MRGVAVGGALRTGVAVDGGRLVAVGAAAGVVPGAAVGCGAPGTGASVVSPPCAGAAPGDAAVLVSAGGPASPPLAGALVGPAPIARDSAVGAAFAGRGVTTTEP